jgi:tRNA (cmo5U34)-methyltransferase
MEQFHFNPDTYMELVTSEVPQYERLQTEIADATKGIEALRMLDLGIGTGETSRRVVPLHPKAELVGVDNTPPMLEKAKAAFPRSDLHALSLQDPLPVGPFELVYSALAIHHLTGQEKADLFQRIAAVLAPGGRFVMGDVVIPEEAGTAVAPITNDWDRPSTVAEQLGWLEDAGFTVKLAWSEQDLAVFVADLNR